MDSDLEKSKASGSKSKKTRKGSKSKSTEKKGKAGNDKKEKSEDKTEFGEPKETQVPKSYPTLAITHCEDYVEKIDFKKIKAEAEMQGRKFAIGGTDYGIVKMSQTVSLNEELFAQLQGERMDTNDDVRTLRDKIEGTFNGYCIKDSQLLRMIFLCMHRNTTSSFTHDHCCKN